ncbi:hypothetical protein [Novipirellula maiorica]|uniref:hypothetical protein n=1 Tax=Novipirellula maiorica TaxID=1265734 RepID=UPI00034AD302|nr:hypothetical protein [Rhodopirellula maiorica]
MNELSFCDSAARQQGTARPGGLNGIDFVNVNYQDDHLDLHLYDAVTIVNEASIVVTDKRRNTQLATRLVAGNGTSRLTIGFTKTEQAPIEGRTYRLRLLRVEDELVTDVPLDNFDPRDHEIDFIYNQTVSSEVDFRKSTSPDSSVLPRPEINYLAKDYGSFRQLILDRLALTMPDWQESHAADTGMQFVELLAYVGDRLSYYQDAVATEGYLETARRRESVRRLARMVDYHMHEGCNSRALLFVGAASDSVSAPEDLYFATIIPASFQIPRTIHIEADLPDEVFPHLVCFEPTPIPADSWRLTCNQIKHPQLFVSLFASRPRAADLQNSLTASLTSGVSAYSSAPAQESFEAMVDRANAILENDLMPSGYGTAPSVSRTQKLPLRERNRVLLDSLLADYISSARIDGFCTITKRTTRLISIHGMKRSAGFPKAQQRQTCSIHGKYRPESACLISRNLFVEAPCRDSRWAISC